MTAKEYANELPSPYRELVLKHILPNCMNTEYRSLMTMMGIAIPGRPLSRGAEYDEINTIDRIYHLIYNYQLQCNNERI